MTTTIGIGFGDTASGVDYVINALKDAKGNPTPLAVTKVHNQTNLLNRFYSAWGPKSTYVLRVTSTEHIFENGVNSWADPNITASNWFTAMQPFINASPYAHFEVGGPGFNTDDPRFATHYANTVMAAMRLLDNANKKGVVLSFYEGNPHTLSDGMGIDGWAPYRPVINLAAQMRFPLGMQGYWVDGNMSPTDDWHNYRLVRVIRDYPGMFPAGTQFLKGEGGIDLKTMPPKGWKTALNLDAKRFMEGIAAEDDFWQHAAMPLGCVYLGTAYFALHNPGSSEWDDFDLGPVLPFMMPRIISSYGTPTAPPPPQDTVVEVGIKDPGTSWLNVRSGPGWLYSKINKFYPTDRMLLSGEALANVVNVEGCWVWCNGTLKDPNKKGWVAGWLLERKPY
ncbi:MAG: hypothetical protein PHI12_15070 [Dehalococcoidales bacterium]|jgi:hypothetical protein|nr:hypothetical protein [Dehalococcoidales bacterium]